MRTGTMIAAPDSMSRTDWQGEPRSLACVKCIVRGRPECMTPIDTASCWLLRPSHSHWIQRAVYLAKRTNFGFRSVFPDSASSCLLQVCFVAVDLPMGTLFRSRCYQTHCFWSPADFAKSWCLKSSFWSPWSTDSQTESAAFCSALDTSTWGSNQS